MSGARFAASFAALGALLLRHRLAGLGALVLLVVAALAAAAPLLPLHNPDLTDLANRLQRPGAPGHPLGTDHLGRDLLARLVWGTRLSLAVGVFASLIAALAGSCIGIAAGFFGGRTDNLLMRGIDMLMAFPYILLALAIVAALGPGLLNALYAVAIVNIPFFARSVRGATAALAHREFVDAARLAGIRNWRIIGGEILPNVAPVICIAMSTTIGWMILETAGLSFLGLGSQPPQADLGSMLGEGRNLLINAPHVSVVPGAMIFVVVVSINLLGDGVRDWLDPRLRAGQLSRPAAVTRIERADAGAAHRPDGALLQVRGLRTRFVSAGARTQYAVNGVDLTVDAGQCLGLIGESGSGKSVTALSLLGLAPSPPAVIGGGRVYLAGEDLLAADFERLRAIRGRRVAYIFQNPMAALHPLMTVGAQLTEAIRCHRRMPRQAAFDEALGLLRQVRMPGAAARARQYPHELSGGMRQRVGIALALANAPELVIADEPTTALDVTVQAQILQLLAQLRRERNLALIFVTHDFAVLSQLCDRVAVMYAGRIVESGPTHDILARPAHPYTAGLIRCAPRLGGGRRPAAIPGLPPAADRLPRGCAFAPRCARRREACEAGKVASTRLSAARRVRCLHPLEAA
ncbi:MAG: dipeptide/oligopeptide/nickel ABC transporter permease/ATP-binding protein [Gammaproteobacteria bacterium]|nr:dipeptide/oligopeptide/nickel ABC transporter permease/ATP-binding protein [Gammaproteobacteria bacterium]